MLHCISIDLYIKYIKQFVQYNSSEYCPQRFKASSMLLGIYLAIYNEHIIQGSVINDVPKNDEINKLQGRNNSIPIRLTGQADSPPPILNIMPYKKIGKRSMKQS